MSEAFLALPVQTENESYGFRAGLRIITSTNPLQSKEDLTQPNETLGVSFECYYELDIIVHSTVNSW